MERGEEKREESEEERDWYVRIDIPHRDEENFQEIVEHFPSSPGFEDTTSSERRRNVRSRRS